MRRRLTDAATDLFGASHHDDVAITDITEHADVAASTFYSHFESKDELIELLGGEVRSEFEAGVASGLSSSDDSLTAIVRVIRSLHAEIRRDPSWVRFALNLRADADGYGNPVDLVINSTIRRAVAQGSMPAPRSHEIVTVMTREAVRASMRFDIDGQLAEIDTVIAGLLRLLGVEEATATRLIADSSSVRPLRDWTVDS